jgi:aspartate carbamoyltransferase regulatory subunit
MSSDARREITIPAIERGTVIDHIPSRETFRILRIIDPREFEHVLNLAINLESKHMGKKGLIKISHRVLTEEEVNKIAILAPNATVSIIEGYKVKEKSQVKIPDTVEKIVKCPNPNCITNNECVSTRFNLEVEEPLKMRCYYCERSIGREDVKLI